MNYQVLINGKDYTKFTPFPIKWNSLLDERLDEARLTIKQIIAKTFAPLTPVKIIVTDEKNISMEKNFIVSGDESFEAPIGSERYNHELMLIEETKILEGIIVDSLTFTNSLGRNFTKNAKPVNPKITTKHEEWIKEVKPAPLTYISPLKQGNDFKFVSLRDVFTDFSGDARVTFKVYNNNVLIQTIADYSKEFADRDKEYVLKLNSGNYSVYYAIEGSISKWKIEVEYIFNSVSNYDPLPDYTITSVINRVLDLAETHLLGTQPRFKLNEAQAVEFDKIKAPEFAFTKATLKEILDQIGGFIHGIPRLKNGVIYYDMLGQSSRAKLADRNKYVMKMFTQNIESYATKLDSSVDNLVNILNPEEGVITEPYVGGFKTVRTETIYARIEEGNLIIPTQYPIQSITSLKYFHNETTTPELEPYVYEMADYQRLSSYEENYPTSKAYALFYTQGQKNISGLTFKVKDAIDGVFKNYSIKNIILKDAQIDIGVDYAQLAFQITYTPIFNARVTQSKQYIGEDVKYPRTLCYNQGANLVETRYYGENMKGVIARIGNVEQTLTYNLSSINLIPEIGEMFDDDFYASSVAVEVQPYMIKCMVGLTKDYNRISQYIGINSCKRFYEVSEKQAYSRDMTYTDYLVVGDETVKDETILTYGGVILLRETFIQSVNYNAISLAYTKGFDDFGNEITQYNLGLPVNSVAMGDAMLFNFKYEDNYSAGLQSQQSSNGSVKGIFTNAVPYGNYYGRIHSLKLMLTQIGPNTNKTVQNNLPAINEEYSYLPEVSTGESRIIIKKDGAEALSVNYQLEFVTNNKYIILGSALSRNCPLVRGVYKGHSAKLYILPKKIGKFSDIVNTSEATAIVDYGAEAELNMNNGVLKFENKTATVDGEAWAILDKLSGELLIGKNISIKKGDILEMPYITPKHNIFN